KWQSKVMFDKGLFLLWFSNTEEAKQGEVCEDVLSPEDAAWVDSCLVNGAELTEDGWDATKDALIDIVSLQTTSQNAPVSETVQVYDNSDPMNEEEYEDLAGRVSRRNRG
ncbi:hypothetical protein MKW94_001125, partial [Papaver nudicaule]|nr:hypothetical protein [Papaver nudicaule]